MSAVITSFNVSAGEKLNICTGVDYHALGLYKQIIYEVPSMHRKAHLKRGQVSLQKEQEYAHTV